MLKNYIRIAMAVLRRRRFFTVISLFGISFTLMILMVLTSLLDKVLSAGYPETNRNRSLYICSVSLHNEKFGYHMNSNGSFYFLNHYAGSIKSAEMLTVFSLFRSTNAYINNKKLDINIKYTDAPYWNVLQYQFTEGRPYLKQQVDNGERVAVISEQTRKNYFGDAPTVTGKYIESGIDKYKVIGVVRNVPVTMALSYADIYVPYTCDKIDYRNKDLQGSYCSIILGKTPGDLHKIASEYQNIVSKIPIPNKDFDRLYSFADGYLESWTRQILGGSGASSGFTTFVLIISVFVFLFMLLPTINLVNINISRIMERSSEIAIRKSFGASGRTLVIQFLTENIILTFLGGLIGIFLSILAIYLINSLRLLPDVVFLVNINVLFYGFACCILFGILSGVYPAWRMSRLKVVTALKVQ